MIWNLLTGQVLTYIYWALVAVAVVYLAGRLLVELARLFLSRVIGLAERWCCYCGKFQGWKYGKAFRHYPRPVISHGCCAKCEAKIALDPSYLGKATL